MREVSIYKKPFICLFVQIKGFYLVWKKTNFNLKPRPVPRAIFSAAAVSVEKTKYYYSKYNESNTVSPKY